MVGVVNQHGLLERGSENHPQRSTLPFGGPYFKTYTEYTSVTRAKEEVRLVQ